MKKELLKKIYSNIDFLENKIKKYDNEFIYSSQTFDLQKKYWDEDLALLKHELEKWNEVLDILLTDK